MNKYTIPNLKNACRVMKFLSEQVEGVTITALAQELDVPRTTMLRIISTLEEEGFVIGNGKKYRQGNIIAYMGMQAMNRMDIRKLAAPVLEKLSLAVGETSHLAQLAGRQMMILEVCDSPNTVRAASRPGTLADIHCSATGKVILATSVSDIPLFMRGVDLNSRTTKTITSLDALVEDTDKTRTLGYGLDDEEYTDGVRCLAAPVYDVKGDVVASIGVTASIITFTRDRIDEVAVKVKEAARELSMLLGSS